MIPGNCDSLPDEVAILYILYDSAMDPKFFNATSIMAPAHRRPYLFF